MKLCNNWKPTSNPSVFIEQRCGCKIHTGSPMLKFPGPMPPMSMDALEIMLYTRIQGGNRKRAVMLWAEHTIDQLVQETKA